MRLHVQLLGFAPMPAPADCSRLLVFAESCGCNDWLKLQVPCRWPAPHARAFPCSSRGCSPLARSQAVVLGVAVPHGVVTHVGDCCCSPQGRGGRNWGRAAPFCAQGSGFKA